MFGSVWAIFPDGIAWVIKMNYGPDWLPFNTMKTSYSNGKVSVEPLESHSFSFILGYYSGDALGNNIYLSENVVKTKANNNMSPDEQIFTHLNQNILHKRFPTKNLVCFFYHETTSMVVLCV